MDFPPGFQEKMRQLLKEDYENFLNSFDCKSGQAFRVNQLKTEPAELFRRLESLTQDAPALRPVPWCPSGARFDGEERLSLLPYYHAGLYYIQEPSAMAPAGFLPVEPGERVLDLCAAPGGKTTAIAEKLKGTGLLVSNDISISRCRSLLKNIQMAGITNAMVTCESPEKLSARFPEYFDKILVDAPCSGEGMFRKDPGMMKSWDPDEPGRYSRLQKDLLALAAAMLRPGGFLMYSTCTYSPEENEQVAETLTADGSFSLLPLPDYPGVDRGHPEWSLSKEESLCCCRRFWHHRVEGEGQFAALLRKTGSPDPDRPVIARTIRTCSGRDRLPDECRDFFRHLRYEKLPGEALEIIREVQKTGFSDRLFKKEERVFLLPREAPDMAGLRMVSSGLHLGDCKKKRFEPGHALALALRPELFDNCLKLSPEDMRLTRYLRGETIEGSVDDGWCLVCVEDYPLGWGKAGKGRIKNKYPPGWRRQ